MNLATTTDRKFYTRSGRLTRYAFACGYIELFESGNHLVTLWHEGGPCYHVRYHIFNLPEYLGGGRQFWESDYKLRPMRRQYDETVQLIRRLKGQQEESNVARSDLQDGAG